jgi:RNA polymerase sigma-70 factor (ECF subfamily)
VEPADNDTPENAYLRAWVRQTVALSLQQLAKEERAKGRSEQFELLRDSLEGQELDRSYAEIAAQLGSTEAAIKVASHRLRRRFRAALLSQLGATVDDAADAEAELRELFHALGGV